MASTARGLSVRDIEATLEEALGEQPALSKSTVSRICHVLVSQCSGDDRVFAPDTF